MRLISWNLNNRVKQAADQIKALIKFESDVIALQEVTQTTAPIFRHELQHRGYQHIVDSFQRVGDKSILTGPRRYGELIASKWPLRLLPLCDIPWEERVLSASIESPFGRVHLHTTHIPPGSTNGWIKIETLEGIYKRLSVKSKFSRILCGDFNTPKEETDDGKIITWGTVNTRWDLGERNVLEGLTEFGLKDVYRYQHGYGVQDFSWYAKPQIGRRFDHIFASSSLLNKVKCRYIHSLRQKKLSDHSAIMADFVMTS
jgi:exonuclease III